MTRSFCDVPTMFRARSLKRGLFGKEVNCNLLAFSQGSLAVVLNYVLRSRCKVYKIRKTINKKRTEKLLISIEYVILDVGKCIPSA